MSQLRAAMAKIYEIAVSRQLAHPKRAESLPLRALIPEGSFYARRIYKRIVLDFSQESNRQKQSEALALVHPVGARV